VLVRRLSALAASVINGVPPPDFGGGHPGSNPPCAINLINTMFGAIAPDLGAARRARAMATATATCSSAGASSSGQAIALPYSPQVRTSCHVVPSD